MDPPPPRTSSTTASRRDTTSPQSSQSESAQDTSRRSSATNLQQSRSASTLEPLSVPGGSAEEILHEPSVGEDYPQESSFSSLHDISALAMSRHQSRPNPQSDRNPSIQLLSPESARNPRRMSQVSPGFIFVIFPMSPRCAFLIPYFHFYFSSLISIRPLFYFYYRWTHILKYYLLTQLPERQRAAYQFAQNSQNQHHHGTSSHREDLRLPGLSRGDGTNDRCLGSLRQFQQPAKRAPRPHQAVPLQLRGPRRGQSYGGARSTQCSKLELLLARAAKD